MADSEVRQKFEAIAQEKGMIVLRYSGERFKIDYLNGDTNRAWEWFQAGMRAGEIAQREKIIKAVCTGCRLGWPEQGRPGHGIVIHVPPDPRGLYACQAVAIRALPAAPEEKK